jgi:hypothetical protein
MRGPNNTPARTRAPALALAAILLALLTGVSVAQAGIGGAVSPDSGKDGGGVGDDDGDDGSGSCTYKRQFGRRNLSLGDCGKDVKTLNWLLRSENFAAPLDLRFNSTTEGSVRDLERDENLPVNGIVEQATRKALVARVPRDRASWYGPGFWGNRTACGQKFRRDTLGVAHRSLPCGTKVVIGYQGKWVRTRVIDRGPYVKRNYTRDWDLSKRAADRIGLTAAGTGTVRAGVIR